MDGFVVVVVVGEDPIGLSVVTVVADGAGSVPLDPVADVEGLDAAVLLVVASG